MSRKIWNSIGLMSGTSMDGIDAALIKTDGYRVLEEGPFLTLPYKTAFRKLLEDLIAGKGDLNKVENQLTLEHAKAVSALIENFNVAISDVDLIGFHGHTISHNPNEQHTLQIGNGRLLASATGVDVVNDLRSSDVKAGGQGAPLAPIYHKALMKSQDLPAIILTIGGVANITWVDTLDENLIGFDTGPGNALIDDWIKKKTGRHYDNDGFLASKGQVHEGILTELLAHPYFSASIPKSLDRNFFKNLTETAIANLSVEDGAATLSAFTIKSITNAINKLSKPFKKCIVAGGGRHNASLMSGLKESFPDQLISSNDIGWSGDAIEAQAFAFLAVRSRLNLPISFPGTTGVSKPLTGGVFHPKN